MITDLFIRIASSDRIKFNPQTLLLCFVYGHISAMIFCRLFRKNRNRKLISRILHYYDTADGSFYQKKKLILCFLISALLLEDAFLLFSSGVIAWNHEENLWAALQRIFFFNIPLCLIILSPASVEFQFSVLCVILRRAVMRINNTLDSVLKSGGELEKNLLQNRLERSKLLKIIKATNRLYGLEMFLMSNVLMFLAIYLCNDMLLMIKNRGIYKDRLFYNLRFLLNVFALAVLFCRLGWMCYESGKLIEEVSI